MCSLQIVFVDFSSVIVAQIPYLIFLYSKNFSCSMKKATILLVAWPTLHCIFLGIMCPRLCFFILICNFANSMSKTFIFKNSSCIKQVVLQKYNVLWIMLVDFNLTLLNLTPNSMPETHLEIQAALWKEVPICLFCGGPCTQNFYSTLMQIWQSPYLL